MINGSVRAPFRHDSTWPGGVLTRFRSAVYYFYVPVPGRDPVNHLRELIRQELRKEKPEETSTQWTYLKNACDKIVHLAIKGVNDEEMFNLVKNLLIFANLLLIWDYGLESSSFMRFEPDESAKKEKYEVERRAARERFSASIDHAYKSLENAIEELRQNGGSRRGSLKLEKGVAVLSSIPSFHHVINAQDVSKGEMVWVIHDTDGCEYEFRPHDPIGWVMMSGNRSKDRFADDAMSSMGVFGR